MDIAEIPSAPHQRADLLKWTSDIVAAYLSRNEMNLKQLPQVMETVYAKLASLGGPDAVIPAGAAAEGTTVAEKSVTPDYIICLEDGVRLKTLKRYLFRKYRLTPEQYRAKWGLPPGYPMVARLSYKASKNVPDAVFRVSIYWPSGYLCAQLTTETTSGGFMLEPGSGVIDFQCPMVPVVPGLYRIDLTLESKGQEVALRQRCATLRVEPGKIAYGDFHIDNTWTITDTASTR